MIEDSEDIWLQTQGFTFLKFDAETGITTWFRTNEDGTTTVYCRSDNEKLLEQNKAVFRDYSKNEKIGDFAPLASIDDLSMQNLHISEAIKQGDKKHLKKVLNDTALSGFRTSSLKV